MEVSHRQVGRVLVVDVDGEPTQPGFAPYVLGLIEDGHDRVVLNLRVTRFDSNCLGEAMFCHMKAFRRGIKLKIVSRDRRVWKLIEALKLDRILDCHRSEEAALSDFCEPW